MINVFNYSELISSFVDLEKKLKNEEIEHKKGMFISRGNIPILISAPHSVEQFREGKIKAAEHRTASIATFLNSQYNCYIAYKTVNFNDDANYDPKSYYKEKLIEIIEKEKIKLLLDLHIMSPTREHNIDLGTGVGNNVSYKYDLIKTIKSSFELFNIEKVKVDSVFKAAYKNTVSATIARRNKIPCFQVEMNWRLLDENNKENRILDVINSLGQIIANYKNYIMQE